MSYGGGKQNKKKWFFLKTAQPILMKKIYVISSICYNINKTILRKKLKKNSDKKYG